MLNERNLVILTIELVLKNYHVTKTNTGVHAIDSIKIDCIFSLRLDKQT